MEFMHKPVLLNEVIEALNIKPYGVYVDCTLGGAGHSTAILASDPTVHLVGIDQDAEALTAARHRLKPYQERVTLVHSNFSNLAQILAEHQVGPVDGILMDIGVSSPQLDQPERGFSYQHKANLDMRMDRSQSLDAGHIVNTYSEADLAEIFFKYGEERFSRRIARFIVQRRESKPIETTDELGEIIKEAIPAKTRRQGPHPAKRCFQALRIAVNDELNVLETTLSQAIECLRSKGRLAVITFHSLEDRIVKKTFGEQAKTCTCPPSLPICVCKQKPRIKLVTSKPIVASSTELEENPRSRSAKLRVAERLTREGS